MAAPLILSVDHRTISDWARELILNKNLIAINQDPLGAMGRRILKVNHSRTCGTSPRVSFDFQLGGDVEIWSKALVNDRTAVSFLGKTSMSRKRIVLVRGTFSSTIRHTNSYQCQSH